MRTFYIFKINPEYATLTKNNPYHLFKMLSYIYNLDTNEINRGIDMFKKITTNFDARELDNNLYQKYQDSYFYTKFKNTHQINNIYLDEHSKLIVRKRFLLLKSSVVKPGFMRDLSNLSNIFFCDFENKDYFWLDKLYV